LGGQPEVLLLDEPAAGLDPVARRELVDVLVDLLAEGTRPTILLSTHIVGDVERLADQVGMMSGGALRLEAGLDDLQQECRRVQATFDSGRVPENFSPGEVLSERREGGNWSGVVRLDLEAQRELEAVPGATVHLFPMGLEDVFIALFNKEGLA